MTDAGVTDQTSCTCATVACQVDHAVSLCCKCGSSRLQILKQACSIAATQPSELVLDQVGPTKTDIISQCISTEECMQKALQMNVQSDCSIEATQATEPINTKTEFINSTTLSLHTAGFGSIALA